MSLLPLRTKRQWPARDWLRWSNRVGIAAAALLGILVNYIAASSNQTWDATSHNRFTLAPSTRSTLAAIEDHVSVQILLSQSDPLARVIRPWVEAYQSSSNRLSLHWTDPDRDPAKFLELKARLGISAGASKDGESLSDSVIVLERGSRKNYVTVEDLFRFDADSGDAEPRIEQALTDGIRSLLNDVRPVICFTQGHRELSVEDRSPAGLSELSTLVQRNLMELRTVVIEATEQGKLADCNLLVIAEPEITFSPWEQVQVSHYRDHSGSLWIMAGTVPDDSGQVRGTGLDHLLPSVGVSLGNNVIIERDERYRTPNGFGESFFADAVEHEATRSLRRGDKDSLRVFVSLAPSVEVAPGAPVQVLLRSSNGAQAVHNVSAYFSASAATGGSKPGQKFTLAIATELGSTPSGSKRRLVISPASVAVNRALRQPALAGNRAFVDGVISWLVARAVGEEGAGPVDAATELVLTVADVNQINRYVLIVMPGAALILALTLAAMQRQWTRRR